MRAAFDVRRVGTLARGLHRARRMTVTAWQREPFRPLFAEAVILLWAGVLHWLLLGLGVLESYRSIFHALAQIQGFMTCLALGFLLTFVPRRTSTPPPARWELAVAMAAPAGLVAFAWLERWAVSQLFWLALVVVLLRFLARRARSHSGPLAPSFVWVPLSFALTLPAGVLTAVGARSGGDLMWLHDLGRNFILQGLFTGLILGVGSAVLPAFLYAEPSEGGRAGGRWRPIAHLALVAVLLASFWVEARGAMEVGYALRGAAPLAALLMGGLHRRPVQPGVRPWLMWIACWMLPAGYFLVALWPGYRRVGLHVVFIGSFALLALSVALHVSRSHSRRAAGPRRSPSSRPVIAFALLVAVTLLFRALVDVDPVRFSLWLSAAAGTLLASTILWALAALRPAR